MYTLLNGFYKYMVKKDEYCVLILGLDNAGKTTYLEATKTKYCRKYKAMNPNRITTTVGLNIGKIDVDGVSLSFWDLGGQQELQSLWDKYYAECHAVIYIVDSSDRDRVSESKETFGTLGFNSAETRRLSDQILTVCRILRGRLDCPALLSEASQLSVPANRVRFRPGCVPLFATTWARTVSRQQSPICRAQRTLNDLITMHSQIDVFADDWIVMERICLSFCETV